MQTTSTTGRNVPSDMTQLGVVTRYEIFRHLRSKRMLGLVGIIVLLVAMIMVLPPALGNSYPTDPAAFGANFTGTATLLIVIAATLFAGDAIVAEFQQRTGYLLFPNPVKRTTLFFGKWMAALLVTFAVIGLYYAVAAVLGFAITGGGTVLLFYSFLLSLLYAAATISVAFFISSLMKGGTGALILVFALLFMIMPMVTGIMGITSVKPNFILTFEGDTIANVMETPYPVDNVTQFQVPGGGNMTIYNYYASISDGVIGMAAYTGVSLVAGIILFKRRELAA
jgi:ABC-2 type transport system permease protein